MEERVLKKLLQQMTFDEKVAQLVQLTPDFFSEGGEITGPMQEWQLKPETLYGIGSVLGTHTAEQVYRIQKQYLTKSRLKIPLVFMADVIHGYETIFPIPLALAATFDTQTIEEVAKWSAFEATKAGVHVTFSPMADYVKDPRWGRVLESNGEDPTLSAELTAAYVRGYQGTNELATEKNRLAACVKHFVGYGAAQGGRDYNTVDFSDLEMHQNYLPAFQAAIDAGAELVMTAFNTVRGIPASANEALLKTLLREKMNFEGVVISDWAAIAELMAHRVAANKKDAAIQAFGAGVDMDMMSDCYLTGLPAIANTIDQVKLDAAVLRVLQLKNKLGLFEDPYRGLTQAKAQAAPPHELRLATRKAAEKTAVLLKNEQILPLKKNQRVALIGPKAASQDILGAWSWIGKTADAVSLASGLKEKELQLSVLDFEEGQAINQAQIDQAKKLAATQDAIILAVGETSEESGEAASLANITLARNQEALIQEVATVNPNIILVVFSGRPLVLTPVEPMSKAIVCGWFPGSEGGTAIANLLMGEVNPQGHLPMSFPRSIGQLPLTYAQMSTGRPKNEENAEQKYISRYMDEENEPLFAFGHGLSYSHFILEETRLSHEILSDKQNLVIEATLKNTSDFTGTAVVQLYLEDLVSQVVRPMRELKKWKVLQCAANKEMPLSFKLEEKDLRYIHSDLTNRSDEGSFRLYLGFDSQNAQYIGTFTYQK